MVDNKVRTDETYPAGFMDVISIEKSGEHFRLLYDIKGRFAIHRITSEEATYKLLKVKKVQLGAKGVPFLVTHDGRTIRYPDPAIKVCYFILFFLWILLLTVIIFLPLLFTPYFDLYLYSLLHSVHFT